MLALLNQNQLVDEVQSIGGTAQVLGLSLPENTPIDRWAEIGRSICRAEQVTRWWIGDWAAFGVRKYGQLKEFADANAINYSTLRDLAWVSTSVELSRRRDNLEWSFHREVAALPPKEQEKWLRKVDSKEIHNRVDLRRAIRQSGAKQNALDSDGPIIKFASKWVDELLTWLRERPESFWTEDHRSKWRQRLEPLVKFYNAL